jgi:hypothetical protein
VAYACGDRGAGLIKTSAAVAVAAAAGLALPILDAVGRGEEVRASTASLGATRITSTTGS